VPSVAVGVIFIGLLTFYLIRRSARKKLSLLANNPLYSDFSKYLSESFVVIAYNYSLLHS
jgi:hypothetical protein